MHSTECRLDAWQETVLCWMAHGQALYIRTTSNLYYDWLQLMDSITAELRDVIAYRLHESCTE